MSGYTWRLIEWFKDHRGESKTRLAINSNLGFTQDKLERLLEATESIELELYTSNESIGRHAIYIRDGLDWDQWCNNLSFLLESKRLRRIHIMCTINALCLVSLTDFLWSLVTLKRKFGRDSLLFTLNILRFPSFQSPLVLPIEVREQYRQELINFLNSLNEDEILHDFEINHVQRLIDYLDIVKTPHSESFDMPKLHNDFKQFYTQYDQRRSKDFRATFPQLTEWYDTL